ncbi:hypothetical protein [Halostagnicola sp. A-GB9-2]|uniref:hypothetical protein n=1 Tax=Halostagnicola sp. A-GB9-2 TaxID=3048066 RepID=UPI0024C09C17|nr:hypothetical protein [Halostagnicola sp. A-GB9-2]MDJ1434795.1 hypothetical protein [Halostagnicola sp. A-GB9-2]
MKRRAAIHLLSSTFLFGSLSGCLGYLDRNTGVKYDLILEESNCRTDNDLFEFDRENTEQSGLEILEEAVEEGYYTEGWSNNESRERAFSEEFNSVIDLIKQRGDEDQFEDGFTYSMVAFLNGDMFQIELIRTCASGC